MINDRLVSLQLLSILLLHYVVFNDSVNVGILCKQSQLQENYWVDCNLHMRTYLNGCSKVSYIFEPWIIGVRKWIKNTVASTSASAVRGMSFNILFLDEFAFVPNHIADSVLCLCISYYHFW